MYKCYYHVSSSSATDFMSKLYTYIEAMGWVKEKGLEVADGAAFEASHAYTQGEIVKPTTANGFVYICSTAGTSAAAEPAWGTTLKGETTSNTAKFRAYNVGRVYSSQSESDAEPKGYIYLYATGDTMKCILIGIIGVAQWAAATWLCGDTAGNILGIGISANPCYSFIYGNKNLIVVCTAYSSSYHYAYVGFFTPVWTQRTTLSGAATAGSGVNLAVASSADVYVGQWLQMWGATEEGRDKVVVSAVPDSTHITVTTLPRNYSSGSWIGVMPVRWIGITALNTAIPANASNYMQLSAAGTVVNGHSICFLTANQILAETDPDYRQQKYLLRPIYYQWADYISGSLWEYGIAGYLPTDIILQQSKSVTSLDLFLVYNGFVYPVTGTATSGGATTLTDTGKSLTIDAWIDKILVITAGTGVGQTRRIISNTATEFTVATWETNPDNTSVYAVVTEAWRALGSGATSCPVVKEVI
jgi:hypothetical protein